MKHVSVPLISALLLSACTVGPDFEAPRRPPVTSYIAKVDAGPPSDQRLIIGEEVAADWWTALHSTALNEVISQALAGNQTIASARARVAEAQEEVNAAEGALLPQLSFGATAGEQKYGKDLFGPADISIPPFSYYGLGPSVNFPLDLFGGQRRTVEEKQAYVDYQRYELAAAYQSLIASVTAEALALAAARAQIHILDVIVDSDQRNIDLVQASIVAGVGTQVQLQTALSQLASDRTGLPDLVQDEAVARHALADSIGDVPAEWIPPDFTLTDFGLPSAIPIGVPSDLVHNRPDIEAAEAQLHLASAAIGVATANLYPQIDLTGTLTQQALTPGALFLGVSNAWSVAASLTQPIFDGGRLSAERRATVDNYQATLATYRQTILTAFGEVADALQALSNDATLLQDEIAASDTAARSLDLARRSYQAGNSGILDVIDAQRSYSEAQLGLARATARRLADTARLYLVLGGSPIATTTNPTQAELQDEQSATLPNEQLSDAVVGERNTLRD
ncbi:MAG: efflux transporter outer membrane subunit [Bradyrhizobium sp.]|nr:efflux transporter outer membrane subunit [Bradyrhizobium sp.]